MKYLLIGLASHIEEHKRELPALVQYIKSKVPQFPGVAYDTGEKDVFGEPKIVTENGAKLPLRYFSFETVNFRLHYTCFECGTTWWETWACHCKRPLPKLRNNCDA
jgi:hypothetical protein